MSEQEFRSIYKQYHKELCYFLNYYTHDEQAIEEVVQDVFVYLWKESDNLNITYLKTYLYSSARNRMSNYLRNEHTRTIILERWAQMELEERQAQDCIDRAEFFLLLQDTIEALPPKCREIFLMSRDERKTYKEIAEEKGISVKTVEAQMGIALKRIREKLLDIHGQHQNQSLLSKGTHILYLDEYNSENINNHTRLVKQNCYRLIRLLNNIEYVSRIDNGTCTLELRKCDIVKLLENIVKISKTYTDKKGIDISFKSEVNKKILSLDIDKVEKIILNILSNAIKFTDTGGRIDINLYMENEQVCISIKDTGIGIPKDKTEVIFENFEQLDTTLSRGCEGTGMGLSVVKKLANLNNIKINVESELNKGSEFIITLPNNIVSKNIKLQDKFAQDEKIDIEFSDIYLNLTS